MFETFRKYLLDVWHFDRVILCLLFWLPATNWFWIFFLWQRVCCEEMCTLVLLQWIMHLFRDHALPNEHPSLLKKSANILWRSGKWHTLTNARCNSAHKKSQMDSSNKFLLLCLPLGWYMIPLQMYPILLKFVPSALLQKENFQIYPEFVHICYKLFLSWNSSVKLYPI